MQPPIVLEFNNVNAIEVAIVDEEAAETGANTSHLQARQSGPRPVFHYLEK